MAHEKTDLPGDAHGEAHGEAHEHPQWSTYWKVAVILTAITVAEVWIYYIPSFVASKLFVPSLMISSEEIGRAHV